MPKKGRKRLTQRKGVDSKGYVTRGGEKGQKRMHSQQPTMGGVVVGNNVPDKILALSTPPPEQTQTANIVQPNIPVPASKVKILQNVLITVPYSQEHATSIFVNKGKKRVSFHGGEKTNDDNCTMSPNKRKRLEFSRYNNDDEDEDNRLTIIRPRFNTVQRFVTLLATRKISLFQLQQQLSSQFDNWPLISRMVELYPSAIDIDQSHPSVVDEIVEGSKKSVCPQLPTEVKYPVTHDSTSESEDETIPQRIVVEAMVHQPRSPLLRHNEDASRAKLRSIKNLPPRPSKEIERQSTDVLNNIAKDEAVPQQIIVEAVEHSVVAEQSSQLHQPPTIDHAVLDMSVDVDVDIHAIDAQDAINVAQEIAVFHHEVEVQRRQRRMPTYLMAIERTLRDTHPTVYLGPMTHMCRYCDALHFACEKTTRQQFVKCCQRGNVVLPPLRPMPDLLRNLFGGTHLQSNHFKSNILRYNYAFQFISLEANLRELPPGRAPPVYCIQGKIYHHISNINTNNPVQRFGPIYFLTPEEAVQQRARNNNNVLDLNLIRNLENTLREVNVYAVSYMHLRQRYDLEVETIERLREQAAGNNIEVPLEIPEITLELLTVRGVNNRPYDLPTVDEVAAIYRVQVDTPPTPNLRVYVRNQLADLGWNMEMRHANDQRRITLCEYYAHRLAIRDAERRFQCGGKLTQQYVVAAYIKIESNRLEYIIRNQGKLRAEQYVGLADYLHRRNLQNDVDEAAALGRMVILPSTFIGSPRAQQQNFQDSMAVVRSLGTPSLFITMTCNPKWREITENIPRGDQACNHPLIISRVFQSKIDQFLEDLLKSHVFGIPLANLCVVEFQKRGLPHIHILTILRPEDKPSDPIRIEQLISAEIPDSQTEPELYEIVTKNMVHNPCGTLNPDAICMKDGKCSKGFPKTFSDTTVIDENGRVLYRRPNNGRTFTLTLHGREYVLDNRWIVPYNAYTLLRYNCHINVETCATVGCVKYLYKYFFKDVDHALVRINADYQQADYNEVETFLNARYMSPPEASWHILQYSTIRNTHTVYRLSIHLPERQVVRFMPGYEQQALERYETTQLTAWFTLNQTDPTANQYLYTDIPFYYVWHATEKRWKKRQRGGNKIVTRMYSVNIRNQELYYLRVLLLHVRGARSFEELRTVDNVVCDTFLQACQRRNLLADDVEWRRALQEACHRDMPQQLRNMFAYMLVFCEIADKLALWNEFLQFFIEDFIRNNINHEEAVQRALASIQNVLYVHGVRLSDFGLPEPNIVIDNNDIINIDFERAEGERMKNQLNAQQTTAFDAILNAVQHDDQPNRLFVLNAAAGCGKSFILQTLITNLRGENIPYICLAPTGLAASLFKGGRTIHSRFKLSLDINETTTCNIAPNSIQGQQIKAAKLFIIDEISMVTRTIFNIIDKALRDICNDNRPFAHRTVVLSGDFRQTLPIVIGGNRATITDSCIKSSQQWLLFKQLNLLTNIRAGEDHQAFSQWLLNLGNGTLPVFRQTYYGPLIQVPSECIVNNKNNLIDFCFGNLNMGEIPNAAILTPLNATCDDINDTVVEKLPGHNRLYCSADSIDLSDDPAAEVANYAVEFLNTLTPSGFPPHRLNLKVGAIIILLRNLNLRHSLCNGTRLVIRVLGDRYIDAEKLNSLGQPSGERVFIPRIDLISGNNVLPFKLRRRQFPVKLAYSMTINKSQGQTLEKIGIYLPNPVFAHGQLYVAFSRTRSFQSIRVFLENTNIQGKLDLPRQDSYTRNIVYRDIL